MKRLTLVLSFLAILFVVPGTWAADKAAITKTVDEIVTAIDDGKAAIEYAADAYDPYVFIMEEGGILLVHPSLAGSNLSEKAPPAYAAVSQATPEGTWVTYEWKEKEKNTYVKKTKSNLTVGSGY